MVDTVLPFRGSVVIHLYQTIIIMLSVDWIQFLASCVPVNLNSNVKDDIIHDQLKAGFIEELTEQFPRTGNVHYLAHRGVKRDSSTYDPVEGRVRL